MAWASRGFQAENLISFSTEGTSLFGFTSFHQYKHICDYFLIVFVFRVKRQKYEVFNIRMDYTHILFLKHKSKWAHRIMKICQIIEHEISTFSVPGRKINLLVYFQAETNRFTALNFTSLPAGKIVDLDLVNTNYGGRLPSGKIAGPKLFAPPYSIKKG